MVMARNGTAGRLGAWAAIVLSAVAMIVAGVTYANEINGKLDRNCRILAAIQGNTRFLLLKHEPRSSDTGLRQIFKASAIESCG